MDEIYWTFSFIRSCVSSSIWFNNWLFSETMVFILLAKQCGRLFLMGEGDI